MIIAIVNSKGGVGKSTMAGNLAGWLALHGKHVILADCDLQQSSSEWIQEANPSIRVVRMSNADQVLDELPSLRLEADYVIADGPGSQTETSRALLMWADLAIVPAKASMFEARALSKNTSFIRQAQAIRHGLPDAVCVLPGPAVAGPLALPAVQARRGVRPPGPLALHVVPPGVHPRSRLDDFLETAQGERT